MTPAPEAAVILRRLAFKLGAPSVALVGLASPEFITGLSETSVAGFDAPEAISYAKAIRPDGNWRAPQEAVDGINELDGPVVGLSFAAIESLEDAELKRLLRGSRAALVCEANGDRDHGFDALRHRRGQVAARGLQVLHEDLIGSPDGQPGRRRFPALLLAGCRQDAGARALTETGLHSLRMDPEVDSWMVATGPARVLIVSYEVVGPKRNGGIGTANTSLALALAGAGHDVTLMFTGHASADSEPVHWTKHFAERGVRYLQLEPQAFRPETAEYFNVRQAWATYERVRELHETEPFDVIHGPECQGHLAYIVQAKRHGIAFTGAQLVTGVHSSTRWCAEANERAIGNVEELTVEFLERTAISLTDVVISPSAYLLDYIRARGWELPERSFVQQYVTSQETNALNVVERREPAASTPELSGSRALSVQIEVVFFGRLEARKGVVAFCDALDRLSSEIVPPMSVTFMGSNTSTVDGRDTAVYIDRRANAWPWRTRLVTDASHADAISHLSNGRCLAVMPSLVDNSPNTVYEALALKIPMLISRSGGTWELVALDELARLSFSGWPDDGPLEPSAPAEVPQRFDPRPLAELLRSALSEPPRPARPRWDARANEDVHLAWTSGIAARRPQPSAEPAPLSVERLAATGADELHDLASRSSAAVLLVLAEAVTADEVLDRVVARAAARSSADVFLFPANDGAELFVPAGGPILAGLSEPVFGRHGFAIRADSLRSIGGFGASHGTGWDGAQVLLRAGLAGLRMEVIPEILVHGPPAEPPTPDGPTASWAAVPPWLLTSPNLFTRCGTLADLPVAYLERVRTFRAMHAEAQRAHAAMRASHEQTERLTDELRQMNERTARAEQTLQTVLETRVWRLNQLMRRAIRGVIRR